MSESKFQADLIKEIKFILPGCLVLKNDANYMQGIPDLLVLYGDRWAMLEVKDSFFARRQPNQEHYINQLDKMSCAAFICPENKEEVLHEVQSALRTGR